MSTEVVFVERLVLRVNGVDLDDCINSVTEEGATPSKYVNTMNKARRPKGVKQGNSTFDLAVNAERIVDATIPDWYGLMVNRTTVQIVTAPNIGPAVTYTGRITKVTDRTSDGDSSRDITVMCWQRK
jgi:hypothetical protein